MITTQYILWYGLAGLLALTGIAKFLDVSGFVQMLSPSQLCHHGLYILLPSRVGWRTPVSAGMKLLPFFCVYFCTGADMALPFPLYLGKDSYGPT